MLERLFFAELVLKYLSFVHDAKFAIPIHHVLFATSDRRIHLPAPGTEAETKGESA